MKIIGMAALVILLSGFAAMEIQGGETKIVTVEVLYMNHGPLRSTIRRLQETFAQYKGSITEAWYDFESENGEDFKKAKGVTVHTPCMIWVDGSHIFTVDGREVSFIGFPSGTGPAQFQGKWTFDDLVKVLDAATANGGK